ncbi:hypothetical protein Tco_0724165 [Tanacetum coccineum]
MNPDPDDVTFQFNQIQLSPEVDDDVTFGFNKVSANDESESLELKPENDDVDHDELTPENDDVVDEDDDVTFGFSQAQIDSKPSKPQPFTPENDDVDNDDDDVTFGSIILKQTQNNNFNQDGKRINDIHVSNVFIESPRAATSSLSSSSSSSSSTTLTAITDSNEMNIKSNSTGFSKLWRFRDNNNINRREGKVVVKKKVKKANVSAHEVYLKKAKGGGEEEKRKSYLPYRPGLMGFFTNVNGGLSKNVHPF